MVLEIVFVSLYIVVFAVFGENVICNFFVKFFVNMVKVVVRVYFSVDLSVGDIEKRFPGLFV